MSLQPISVDRHESVAARAVVFREPRELELAEVEIPLPGAGEVLVEVEWTGISTGTEKLLYDGQMPAFPGMGYPLVPGYETVGRVSACGEGVSRAAVGDRVFVTGARCFGEIRGLFGGAASKLVVEESKLLPVSAALNEDAILLSLAATAHHCVHDDGELALPDLIIGHGVVGRLIARLTVALGVRPPVVWETNAQRAAGDYDYPVVAPDTDTKHDYQRILDASGDSGILDSLVARLAHGGEIVLAGFYSDPLSLTFPPAFMREARIRVAAEFTPDDLVSVRSLIESGALALSGLISHRLPASAAAEAYPLAFTDPDCLKMVLDWRNA